MHKSFTCDRIRELFVTSIEIFQLNQITHLFTCRNCTDGYLWRSIGKGVLYKTFDVKVQALLCLNFDVNRFVKYSFSYGTSHIIRKCLHSKFKRPYTEITWTISSCQISSNKQLTLQTFLKIQNLHWRSHNLKISSKCKRLKVHF